MEPAQRLPFSSPLPLSVKKVVGLGLGALLALSTACAPTPTTPTADSSPTETQAAPPAETTTATPTPTETTMAPEGEESEEPSATEAPEGPLDAAGAIAAALAHTPGAVVEVDAERSIWEVTVLREDGTGVELYIDATSGEVTRERDQRLSPTQRTAPTVTAAEAIDIALGAVPGTIIELDLGLERTTVVWEVLVRADAGGRMEVYVDAATGSVVKTERAD
ncbi:MAG TPA: PepSY domain-containing protein [Arachnia sp.]|nr:PepSY domain-containing protein [Arachnia sp.]HMT86256.1 PepSY domain-containing protein [Arachnia sp.]